MKKHYYLALVLLAFLTIFCTEELIAPVNNKPVIQLAVDKSTTATDTVLVTCTATDADQDSLTYRWTTKFGAFTTQSETDTLPATIKWYPEGLSDGSYYVTVRVFDGINEPSVDSIKIQVHLNIDYPVKPTLISPAKNETKVANNINLKWETIIVEGKELKFDLFWGKDQSSLAVETDLAGTDTTYLLSDLEYNTEYFWFIRAKYDDGKHTDSDTNSFSTRPLLNADLPSEVEFVAVGAGEFTQGKDDAFATVDYDFEIMKYEVTNKLYADFLNSMFGQQAVYFDKNDVNQIEVLGIYDGDEHINSDTNFVYFNLNESEITFDGSNFAVPADSNDYPVRGVTWFGANAFAKYYKLSLPSEKEWEKAARGNTGNDYPASDTLTFAMANIRDSIDTNNDAKLDTVLNIFGGSTKIGFYNGQNTIDQETTTIDYKSPYGAYDMAGNVLEWTSDIYEGYRKTAGGSFMIRAESSKSWQFHNYEPGSSINHIGFRCIKK